MTDAVEIESLDLEAHGVARREGMVVFVRGALPGERVRIQTVRRKPKYEVAQVTAIDRASPLRVEPRCPHFGVCGGCSMQHMDSRAQVSIKQRVLEDTLWHVGRVRAVTILPPIHGAAFGYRHRARLSVRNVPKKGGVLIGFHERGSSYVADMRTCAVLPQPVSDLLMPLRRLVAELSIVNRLPQIELAQGEGVLTLVFRTLDPPSPEDLGRLTEFGQQRRIEIWLQPAGPDSITLLWTPEATGVSALSYALPEFGVRMPFRPTDFTQVNASINAVLVRRAVDLLAPLAGERIADLFCGLGNFTLPIARTGATVIGIEGSRALVQRANDAARVNGLTDRVGFEAANLFELSARRWAELGPFDRVLIDPPREGAQAVCQVLSDASTRLPRRLVYVSCNPATLARDAAILVHEGGWSLRAAGVVNMFPQTSHVESIAVFEPPDRSVAFRG